MTLEYTLNQIQSIYSTVEIPTTTSYQQAGIKNILVDDFTCETSTSGLNYRYFSPVDDDHANPLIIWLHGAGEGGSNNETQITGNQGAVAFASKDAQDIFGGAYVVAPQSPDCWMDELDLGRDRKSDV